VIRGRVPRLALAAALPAILSGCVAAVLPVAAGALVANKQAGDVAGIGSGGEITAGSQTPAPPPEQRVAVFAPGTTPRSGLASSAAYPQAVPTTAAAATPAIVKPEAVVVPTPRARLAPAAAQPKRPANPAAGKRRGKQGATLTTLTQLPPPSGEDPYAAFTRYALGKATTPGATKDRLSALVDQTTLTDTPKLAACADQPLAVLVDLDPGAGTFDLDNPPLPAPGLAEKLTALRSAGITVLWSAGLPVASAERLYTILSASGLDPGRTDRLLLVRDNDERKQTRRIAAARDWCILAIAGDRRSDFDEVFDFLRDPEGPVALALAPNIGAGWFLAPPPID
jgi:hypothetical protein